MQISITNGTLTQVQETLSPSSGYVLPSSVTVTGATSSYNDSTGVLTLTSPTSTMSITASGEPDTPTPSSSITIGNLNISSISLGSLPIVVMYFGSTKIYEASTPTPTLISFSVSRVGTGTSTYQAEEGMTWLEWVNSAYNIDNYTCYSESSNVYNSNGMYSPAYNNIPVYGRDTIVADYNYSLVGGGN